jgi:hypothetical protein
MESNKHNDELIKRKLADVSVEPRKLKFAAVHANYLKAAKASSSKRWGLYFIVGIVGIASLVGAYYVLTPNTSATLAETDSAKVPQEYSTPDHTKIRSVGTSNEDKFTERNDAKPIESSEKNTKNNTLSSEENSKTTEVEEKTVAAKTVESSSETKKETFSVDKKADPESTSKNNKAKISKKETAAETTGEKEEKEEKAKNTSAKNTEKALTANSNTTANSSNNNTKAKTTNSKNNTEADKSETNTALAKKENSNKPVIKGKAGNERSGDMTNTLAEKKKKNSRSLTNEKTSDSNGSMANSDGNGKPNNTKDDQKTNDQNGNSENKNAAVEDPSDTKAEENTNENKNADIIKPVENSTIVTTSTVVTTKTLVTKDDKEEKDAINSDAVGSGSVSPRNKHKFILGTEIAYNMLSYETKANTNAPSQFNQGEPGFVNTYVNSIGSGTYKLFNGSAYLSYVYNEGIGFSSGISFFNLETKVNTQAFGSKKTTLITDSVWSHIDTNSNQVVIDSMFAHNETRGNYAVVNGDTVKNQDYLNNIRFITIPFRFSYNFNIGPKFSFEPQAGILYAIPLNSYQLVATRAYVFEYRKTKDVLNPRNIYFDIGMKFGYKISNNAQLYLKQSYFFRKRSIYNADQPQSLQIKNIYTSFGIAIRLK